MKKIELTETTEPKLVSIRCNACGTEIPRLAEGVFPCAQIEITWPYGTSLDGETHSFDLCEDCYKAISTNFPLPADVFRPGL